VRKQWLLVAVQRSSARSFGITAVSQSCLCEETMSGKEYEKGFIGKNT
jgi:hypothetical protein